ncbi:hypothetical protein Pelo_12580 [Pelomyxa schiedti]|nr:hypothetical protein Pelo_12580 [Pelomyxa schiedti]
MATEKKSEGVKPVAVTNADVVSDSHIDEDLERTTGVRPIPDAAETTTWGDEFVPEAEPPPVEPDDYVLPVSMMASRAEVPDQVIPEAPAKQKD